MEMFCGRVDSALCSGAALVLRSVGLNSGALGLKVAALGLKDNEPQRGCVSGSILGVSMEQLWQVRTDSVLV
jgi:hypothetical protein